MKKTKKTIGAVMTIAGLFLAICTADNSAHEIALRFGGVMMFAIGAYLAEAYDFQQKRNEETERKVDHDPYPDEFGSGHPVGEIQ